MGKWRCRVCGYIYDEERGETATATPAGTTFSSLPDTWRCPICQAGKEAFTPEAEGEPHGVATTTVSEVIIRELEKWGVKFAFAIPGTSSLGIIDALRKSSSIRLIVVRHEENAAMAASAYFKLTGNIAACVTIAGPGATNLSTGLYDAKEDSASVISINGQVEAQYTGPGGFQEIDQDAFFRPVTVWNNTIYNKEMTVQLVTAALRYATVYKGVAQLSVPNNVQKEPLDAAFCTRESCLTNFNILPDPEELGKAAALINSAKRPVIIAGWGAYGIPGEVLAIAEKIGAPILTTFRAKGIIPDDNPWLMGILGTVGSIQARDLARNADLLITFGVGFSKMTSVPSGVPLVQVDIDPVKIGKNPFSVALWGNCRLVLPALNALLRERKDDSVLPMIAKLKSEWDAQRDLEADPDAVPVRPPYIMKVLSETVPEDAVITIDVGENGWWFGRNFRMKRQRMVMSGYLATMGFSFPAAIAAKLAYPGKTVVCITGDGGFSMAMSDFVTAVKYNLPMVVVILNNRQLGMIQVEQKMENYPNFGTDLLNPDFAAYADNSGGIGIKVTRPGELKPAVLKAIEINRPVIIDVNTDPKRF
jgi:pyruvate oxidase